MAGHQRPWGAGGGPDETTLREMVRTGMTDVEIGDQYGVARQTVAYWRGRSHIKRRNGVMSHKQWIPWELNAADAHDSVAKRLREHSTIQQGGKLDTAAKLRLDKFLAFLREEDVVVDYDREKGFQLRRRDPTVDAPGDLIRRPPE
jgi:DNA-binding CsgD family transcriptional regulator